MLNNPPFPPRTLSAMAKGEPEFLAVGLLDGVAGKAGIVEEGMAVGSKNVTEAFEGTAKTDLLVVAHYLYVCSLVETKDDAAALLLDELLATAAANVTKLLFCALQSELTGNSRDGVLIQTGALGHLLVGQVGVFHDDKGSRVAFASRGVLLLQSEPASMTAYGTARAADM